MKTQALSPAWITTTIKVSSLSLVVSESACCEVPLEGEICTSSARQRSPRMAGHLLRPSLRVMADEHLAAGNTCSGCGPLGLQTRSIEPTTSRPQEAASGILAVEHLT
jgi:hypothetical protein